MEKIKMLELFTGIGAFSKALTNLNIPFELVGFSEIDKYAVKSYCAIHGVSESLNLGDITKIDERKLPDFDLMTYGFPCQDISVAGKQKGIELGTRSGLLYEALRIIQYKMPKYAIAENVKNLVGKKFKGKFDELIAELEFYGYNSYWKVLNAKDYGVPQNRERVFIVSIRKDVDDGKFEFPIGFDNGLRLKDLLESEVDEKYYISQEKTEKLISQLKDGKRGVLPNITNEPLVTSALGSREHRCSGWKEIVGTLCARDYKDPKCVAIPCLTPDRVEKRQNGRRFKESGEPMFTLTGQDRHGILQVGMLDIKGNEQIRRVYSPEGCSPTLNTCGGGNREPKILECPNKLKFVGGIGDKDWAGDGKENSRNYPQGNRVYDSSGISCSQTAQGGGIGSYTGLYLEPQYRIRKLTSRECFRLMSFTDEDFDKASKVCSNSQLYKQAGNSISVCVLEEIFKNLFKVGDDIG